MTKSVREALDLCLSCKGCKHDCPVQVDMATYKAEFLSHYYERRLRPRYAYTSGLIYWWARAAGAHARDRQLLHADAGDQRPDEARRRATRSGAISRRSRLRRSSSGSPNAVFAITASRRLSCGPTHSTTTSLPRSRKQRSTCSNTRDTR